MQLVGKFELSPPNICALCEQAPYDDDQMIDTGFFELRYPTSPLYGRKYVCPRCANDVASLTGYVREEEALKKVELESLARQEEFDKKFAEALEAIKEFLPTSETKPKATSKK